jgi:hypothetical protein
MSRDGSIVVAFDDIDRVAASIRAHAEFVRSRVPRVAGAASDPDFLASLPLSPFTGVQAEGAVLSAAGGLAVQATTWEAVAVISATVVTTYRLAEDALTKAAASLRAAGSLVVLGGGAIVGVKAAADSFVAGFGDEFVESLVPGLLTTLDGYREKPEQMLGGSALFGVLFASNVVSAFEMKDTFAHAILRMESSLGATGPLYDDILRALIVSGNTFGFFVDRHAKLGPSAVSKGDLANRSRESAKGRSTAIYGREAAFNLDPEGHIVPSDIPSLFASGRQIDDIGRKEFATIRVITCTDDDGGIVGHIVQISSTQSFSLSRESAPNDLTTDLHAMEGASQTELAESVLEAMRSAGIHSGPDEPPILMAGFSLGGITAAALASDNSGYNIQQVVTAGSPIARFEIPKSVGVLAYEFEQDLVPALDGRPNPARWNTVQNNAPTLGTEDTRKVILPDAAHDLDRYARMAAGHPNAGSDPGIAKYFDGHLTVNDYYVHDLRVVVE